MPIFEGTFGAVGALRERIDAGERCDVVVLTATLVDVLAIYVPDPGRATAGIHFAAVLKRLGVDAAVAARIRAYPNGAAATAALARRFVERLTGPSTRAERRSAGFET